jgi:hypothetical protein
MFLWGGREWAGDTGPRGRKAKGKRQKAKGKDSSPPGRVFTVSSAITGGIVEIESCAANVEVGDGVFGMCRLSSKQQARSEVAVEDGRPDLAWMAALLAVRGKQDGTTVAEPARAGQIRSVRVAALDAAAKRIEMELAG